jgi:hypothetical protein
MCDPHEFRIVKVERRKMRGWCVAISILWMGLSGMAQSRVIEVTVLDSLEGAPVGAVDVSLSDSGASIRCVTDEAGHCVVQQLNDAAITIAFTRAGYKPQTVEVRWKDRPAKSALTVRLAPFEMTPVEVTRPKPEVIFQRPDLHAADLLINDEGIWVLAYEHPRMIRAEGEAGEEILRDVRLVLLDSSYHESASCPVPEEVKGLRRDLHNTVVIEGTSRAFDVARTADDIELVPFGLEDLRGKVLPWTDSIPGWVLGSNTDKVMPVFDHLAYDPISDSTRVVCTVMDTFMLSLFRSEYKYLKGPEKVVAMNLASELGVDKEVVAGYMSGFQHNIWFKPVYAPLFVVGDTMLVFDHAAARLRKFTRDFKEAGRVPLPYLSKVEGRDWSGRIIQDRKAGALYAVFQRNGYQWLRVIDPVTGLLGQRTRLTYRYPERTQVFDGHVYYVYRPFESMQKRSIYREKVIE